MIPNRTVNVGGITSSLAMVTAWAAKEFYQVTVPTEIGIAIAGLFVYVVQWIVPDR